MGRIRLALIILIALSLFTACSEQNLVTQNPHGKTPLDGHSSLADLQGVEFCQACHGENYDGGASGVSCLECHSNGPPFSLHPKQWGVVVDDHQTFATEYHWTTCSNPACHGESLRGDVSNPGAGPSCFTSCHPEEAPIPHIDFLIPANHGPAGRDAPRYCFNCHGDLPYFFQGGFVLDMDDPNPQPADCSLCHTAAEAHPTNWAGDKFPTHRDVQVSAIGSGCALCHSVSGPGAGPRIGAPSCFSDNFSNASGNLSVCHSGGPGPAHLLGQPWLDKSAPEFHGDSSLDCGSSCHDTADTNGLCYDCHFGPSGSKTPSNWKHGEDEHEDQEDYLTTCNSCHDTNRLYGNSPDDCHDCHPPYPDD